MIEPRHARWHHRYCFCDGRDVGGRLLDHKGWRSAHVRVRLGAQTPAKDDRPRRRSAHPPGAGLTTSRRSRPRRVTSGNIRLRPRQPQRHDRSHRLPQEVQVPPRRQPIGVGGRQFGHGRRVRARIRLQLRGAASPDDRPRHPRGPQSTAAAVLQVGLGRRHATTADDQNDLFACDLDTHAHPHLVDLGEDLGDPTAPAGTTCGGRGRVGRRWAECLARRPGRHAWAVRIPGW